jgi:hypothetical protein
MKIWHKTVPCGTSGSGNFQNNQNSDSQNSRSHSKSQILNSENPKSGYFENYQNQNWCRQERSKNCQ